MHKFRVGDMVAKNLQTWVPSDDPNVERYRCGLGYVVALVSGSWLEGREPYVDVLWTGKDGHSWRYYEHEDHLLIIPLYAKIPVSYFGDVHIASRALGCVNGGEVAACTDTVLGNEEVVTFAPGSLYFSHVSGDANGAFMFAHYLNGYRSWWEDPNKPYSRWFNGGIGKVVFSQLPGGVDAAMATVSVPKTTVTGTVTSMWKFGSFSSCASAVPITPEPAPEAVELTKHKCHCPREAVVHHGCKCGGV